MQAPSPLRFESASFCMLCSLMFSIIFTVPLIDPSSALNISYLYEQTQVRQLSRCTTRNTTQHLAVKNDHQWHHSNMHLHHSGEPLARLKRNILLLLLLLLILLFQNEMSDPCWWTQWIYVNGADYHYSCTTTNYKRIKGDTPKQRP